MKIKVLRYTSLWLWFLIQWILYNVYVGVCNYSVEVIVMKWYRAVYYCILNKFDHYKYCDGESNTKWVHFFVIIILVRKRLVKCNTDIDGIDTHSCISIMLRNCSMLGGRGLYASPSAVLPSCCQHNTEHAMYTCVSPWVHYELVFNAG